MYPILKTQETEKTPKIVVPGNQNMRPSFFTEPSNLLKI